MDGLEETLSSILSDPESMAKVKEMAQNLFGSTQNENEDTQKSFVGSDFSGDLNNMISPEEMGRIINIVSMLKSQKNDSRANLLLSLKPHLCMRRQEKVDTAVKLLKIIEILPLIKESGLLNL